MRLEPGKLVYGVAPDILSAAAYRATRRVWEEHTVDEGGDILSFETFCWALGAPEWEARPVLLRLAQDGFLAPHESDTECWQMLQPFRQLALATIGTGITRATAESLLAQVIARAGWINAHPDETLHVVRRIAVFGSYLTDVPQLGDLDLAVDIRELPNARARMPGNNDYAKMLKLDALGGQVERSLRLRRPKQISLHDIRRVEELGTPMRIVFEAA